MIKVVVVTGVSDVSAIDGEVAGTSGMLVAVEDASLIMTLVIVFGAGILETAEDASLIGRPFIELSAIIVVVAEEASLAMRAIVVVLAAARLAMLVTTPSCPPV